MLHGLNSLLKPYLSSVLTRMPLGPFHVLNKPAPVAHGSKQGDLDDVLLRQAPHVPNVLIRHQMETVTRLEAECATLTHERDVINAYTYLHQAALGASVLLWAHCLMFVFVPPFSVIASFLFLPLTFVMVPLKDDEAASRAARNAAVSALGVCEGELRQAVQQLDLLNRARALQTPAPSSTNPEASPVTPALQRPKQRARANPFNVHVQNTAFDTMLERARPFVREYF
jgi:hypothetical protein